MLAPQLEHVSGHGAPLTQQVRVQSQNRSLVRRGLRDDQADQAGVEARQSEQGSGHHSAHRVTYEHHALRGGLQVLQDQTCRMSSSNSRWNHQKTDTFLETVSDLIEPQDGLDALVQEVGLSEQTPAVQSHQLLVEVHGEHIQVETAVHVLSFPQGHRSQRASCTRRTRLHEAETERSAPKRSFEFLESVRDGFSVVFLSFFETNTIKSVLFSAYFSLKSLLQVQKFLEVKTGYRNFAQLCHFIHEII